MSTYQVRTIFLFLPLQKWKLPSFLDDTNTPGRGQCNSFFLSSRVLGVAGGVFRIQCMAGAQPRLLWDDSLMGHFLARCIPRCKDLSVARALCLSEAAMWRSSMHGLYSNVLWSANCGLPFWNSCSGKVVSAGRCFIPENSYVSSSHIWGHL